MKRKIAYFTPDCFIDVDLPVLSRLAQSFDVEWHVLYTCNKEFYKYTEEEIRDFALQYGIGLNVYARKYRLRNLRNIPLLIRMFLRLLRAKPQMIYFTAEDDLYFSVLATLLFPVSKTVKGIHNVVLHERYDTFLKKLAHSILRKRFRYFHFFSNHQAEHFKRSFQLSDSFITRLGQAQGNTLPVYSDKEKETTHFIFFGKITYYKGVDILIHAVNKLAAEHKNFKVTIAGRCDDWDAYQMLIQAFQNIELNIQMVSNEQLRQYLAQCHFVVLPYRSVTQSGVLTIYYNSFIPAIASDIDGFNEYVTDGVNGLTFKSEDPDALYRAMKKAVEMNKDEYNAMRKSVAHFAATELDSNRISDKYAAFFNSVIERPAV